MGYVNIFQKLDQDISSKLQTLQVQQKELLERKKALSNTKQEIQNFLDSAQDVKKLIESQPELVKSLRTELGKIFAINNVPKLPLNQGEKTIAEKSSPVASQEEEQVNIEEESINDFKFVDVQGQNTSIKVDK